MNRNQIRSMGSRRWVAALALLVLCISSCGPARTPAPSPAEVVYRFYRWYIGYPGNVLTDREYRSSPYLAPELIAEIDETLNSFQGGGYDPILLAQDIPQRFEVGEAVIDGDRAAVPLSLYWGQDSTASLRQIELLRIDGEWKIRQITDTRTD